MVAAYSDIGGESKGFPISSSAVSDVMWPYTLGTIRIRLFERVRRSRAVSCTRERGSSTK